MKRNPTILGISLVFAAGIGAGVYLAKYSPDELPSLVPEATAQEASGAAEAVLPATPTSPVPNRDVYYPGSEELGPNEMRVVCAGTGMPNARPKQAAACFLVELGNGDKFIFDAGLGCAERIAAMKIPYDYLDKVFIGHLHADHIGDLDALWVGGSIANRQRPLRVWGPSGAEERLGTAYMVEKMQEMYAWDIESRQGNVNTDGLKIETNEFDYRDVVEIYNENGVKITSIPAIHGIDGSVSFILEWNGLKFFYSSDTYPNKWEMEHAKDCDIVVHECFSPPSIMHIKQRFPVGDALNVSTQVHTAPAMFGKIMAEIKPRMAVGYHTFNDWDTQPQILKEIRKTYDGPVEVATDYMVFNVTQDEVKVRMAAVDEDIWPLPSITEKKPANPEDRVGFSEDIMGGRVVFEEVIQWYYDSTNEQFGTDYEAPLK